MSAPPPTETSAESLVLTDTSGQETITASFNTLLNLRPPPGWFFSVSDPATTEAPLLVFPIPLQVSNPPDPVVITLIRGGTEWATLGWRQENVTALPATTTSSSAPSTAPSSSASTTSTRSTASFTTTTSSSTGKCTSEPPGTGGGEGIGPGEAVGLGIGSAIAGGLLVFLVGLCYMRRRKPREPTDCYYSSARSHESISPPDPQTIEDESLRGEASQLEGSIRNYVDNYLSGSTAAKSRSGDHDAERDAKCSRYAAHKTSWQKLFRDSKNQDGAWRMFIARVLAARVDAKGAADVTLLPSEALSRYQDLTTGREPTTHYKAWCKVQASMIQNGYPQDERLLGPGDARNNAVDATVRDVKSALGPFRHKERGAESEDDALKQLVVDAALFGWRLFSQTDIIELSWSDSPGVSEVFPGVQRTVRDGGQKRVIREPSRLRVLRKM